MKKSTLLLLYFIVHTVLSGYALPIVSAQEQPLITSIEVRGLRRIENAAVRSKITHMAGESLSSEKTAQDIKNIYRMGYFDDVRVEIEPFEGGAKLIYLIKEKPTIIKIDFQGNKEIEDSKLKEKITITANSISDTVLIQDNADKLRTFYEEEGYWLSKIVPVIKKISDAEVSLTYQIEEGPKVKIKDIIIEGNKSFSKKQIKKVMKTDTWWMFSFITSSGYYKKETMISDIEKIRELYFNNGYIKVAVADPVIEITEDKKGMKITLMISEGDRFKISSVEIVGNKAFSEDDLKKKIQSLPNNVFSRGGLRRDVAAMTEMYSENGYALVSIYPDLIPDDASKQIKISFKIEEGDIYRVGRIDISGNSRTRDKVIRREVRLDEGDIFNSKLLRRSYERIGNLNFFESVDMQPRPRPDEKLVDIGIRVKERPTGSFSVGGGYSSVDKLIGTIDVTQGNLFGRGQYIKLKGEFGGTSTTYELSFRDPWFLDRPISFGTGIYKTTRDYSEYNRKATGFDISLGKNLSEYWRGDITYNYERATISDIADDASSTIKEQEGTKTTSSITPSITRDSRDNFLDPHTGSRNSFYVTYAGLGGDNNFVKGNIDSTWFFPLGVTTISLRGRYGYATGISGKTLPLYERFYVGGIYTIRGLDFGEAGPRDSNGEVIGGTKQIIFNAEYIFPILSELRLKGVIFFDAGRAFDSSEDAKDLRYTTGGGVRWISPIGPLRLEWGYNIAPKPGEDKSRWEFTFGSFF
ncbi:MAG: outer membrane protein assembly factor BamA [Nitrospirae bacterium]|nr:outer membrane protein assembly factor BamA [Nitrospirota bacterium]